jgi:hypothetical protein
MQPNGDFDFGKVLQVIQDHPGLCVAAAAVCGIGYLAMGSENRGKLGSAIEGFANQMGYGGGGSAVSNIMGMAGNFFK